MGQSSSSQYSVVNITHKYADPPPSGWRLYGTVRFHVKRGEKVRDLIDKINEYRSPHNKIDSVRDSYRNIVPKTEVINDREVIYFV